MSSSPLMFSVIMGVHKLHEHLGAAISSILDQDYDNLEFIICVNGEARGGKQFIVDLCRGDPRVRIIESEIGQLAYILNLMADSALGSWLVRMDSDDVSKPERLSTLHGAILASDCEILGSAAELIDDNGRLVGKALRPLDGREIRARMKWSTPFIHPTVAIKREVLFSLRGYNAGFVTEDIDLWLRAERAGVKMRNLDVPLLQYRLHSGQVSRSNLVYAEGAGHRVREFFVRPTLHSFTGAMAAVGKCLIAPILLRRMFGQNGQAN